MKISRKASGRVILSIPLVVVSLFCLVVMSMVFGAETVMLAVAVSLLLIALVFIGVELAS